MKCFAVTVICLLFGASVSHAAQLREEPAVGTKAADEAVLFREPSDVVEDPLTGEVLEDPSAPIAEPGASVNIREEFKFDSRQNIDSFLGEYENPYAASEDTYKGSRSEMRQDLDKRPF